MIAKRDPICIELTVVLNRIDLRCRVPVAASISSDFNPAPDIASLELLDDEWLGKDRPCVDGDGQVVDVDQVRVSGPIGIPERDILSHEPGRATEPQLEAAGNVELVPDGFGRVRLNLVLIHCEVGAAQVGIQANDQDDKYAQRPSGNAEELTHAGYRLRPKRSG